MEWSDNANLQRADDQQAPNWESKPPASQPTVAASSGAGRNLGLLIAVFLGLTLLYFGKFIVGQYAYHAKLGEIRAEVEGSTAGLSELRPRLDDLMSASRLVAKRMGPSVVSIHRADIRGGEGQGSGVIIDPRGYIVTNFHVIEGAAGLHVRLDDGRFAEAMALGADPATDIAILKINLPDLIAAEWGNSDELQVGDLVWAVGSPLGLDRSITFGIVSAKERRTGNGFSGSPYQEFLQTDVAVNPGNSGGPLVDLAGKVVGINTAIAGQANNRGEVYYQGISFAIPSNLARETYERLMKDGWIERGYLGIRPMPVPDRLRERYDLGISQGVLVQTVNPPGGPADLAGIRPGDVILKWNDHVANDPTLLSRTIASTEIGSEAEVLIRRLQDGQPVDLTLKATVGLNPMSVRPTGREE